MQNKLSGITICKIYKKIVNDKMKRRYPQQLFAKEFLIELRRMFLFLMMRIKGDDTIQMQSIVDPNEKVEVSADPNMSTWEA